MYDDGEQLMMTVVRALPPSDSCKSRVSLLSRYGMCFDCRCSDGHRCPYYSPLVYSQLYHAHIGAPTHSKHAHSLPESYHNPPSHTMRTFYHGSLHNSYINHTRRWGPRHTQARWLMMPPTYCMPHQYLAVGERVDHQAQRRQGLVDHLRLIQRYATGLCLADLRGKHWISCLGVDIACLFALVVVTQNMHWISCFGVNIAMSSALAVGAQKNRTAEYDITWPNVS